MNIESIILKTAACLSILLPMHLNAADMIAVSPKSINVKTIKNMPKKFGSTGFRAYCKYTISYDKEKRKITCANSPQQLSILRINRILS